MIYAILLIIVVSFWDSNASKPVQTMPPQSAEKFLAAATQCIKEAGAPEEYLKLTLPWKMPQNELSQKYLFCLGQTTKLARTDGHYYADKVIKLFVNSVMKEEIEKTINECNALEGEDILDVNFKITDCFHAKAPVILSL